MAANAWDFDCGMARGEFRVPGVGWRVQLRKRTSINEAAHQGPVSSPARLFGWSMLQSRLERRGSLEGEGRIPAAQGGN